jgi:hypothetical protein
MSECLSISCNAQSIIRKGSQPVTHRLFCDRGFISGIDIRMLISKTDVNITKHKNGYLTYPSLLRQLHTVPANSRRMGPRKIRFIHIKAYKNKIIAEKAKQVMLFILVNESVFPSPHSHCL